MTGILACTLAFGMLADPYAAEEELSPQIRAAELKAHVYRLASPEFLGRKGPGAARASAHIAAAFKRLGLRPAFGDSYFQPVRSALDTDDSPHPNYLGRNVGAILPGTDPKLKSEWVLLGAHFDHLGKVGDEYFPGAEDNASSVAMMLEVAERFALQKEKPRRTVVFVAFDLEEVGLLGSTYFAIHPPLPIRQLKAFLTGDLLGRSMANVMDEYVFVMGSERSAKMRQLVEGVKPPKGLKAGRLGADIVGTRSDYGPFRDRSVPFLFFSTGQHRDYHQTSDRPEKLDYAKLERISRWIADLTWRLATDDDAPTWQEKPGTDLDEVRTILVLVKRVMGRPDRYPLSARQRDLMGGVAKRLGDILDRGKVTSAERTWLVWTSRLLLATVF